MPQGLEVQKLAGVAFIMEASSAVGKFNLQTDEHKTPSHLTIRLNGIVLEDTVIPDAPADTRGFLSYLHAGSPRLYGSYGYLLSTELSDEDIPLLKESLRQERAFVLQLTVPQDAASETNGLRVYGDRLGRYAVDPCLVVRMEAP